MLPVISQSSIHKKRVKELNSTMIIKKIETIGISIGSKSSNMSSVVIAHRWQVSTK